MSTKIIYHILLVLINIIGLFFLGLIFLGTPNINEEALNHVSEGQALLKQFLYVFTVSITFSVLSLLLSFLFKRKLSLTPIYLKRLFLIQSISFILVYVIIYIYMSIRFS